MLTDQGEGKRQKMTSSESDAAGGASAPASLGSRQPVTPPKAPAVEPSGSVASEAAGPALSEAAGPAPSQAVGPVEPQPAVEKEYALADLRSVVTTLGALDACLQHLALFFEGFDSRVDFGTRCAARRCPRRAAACWCSANAAGGGARLGR